MGARGSAALVVIAALSLASCASALPVAVAQRQSLIELSNLRFVQQGQETKMEQVYQYLTGTKFRQRAREMRPRLRFKSRVAGGGSAQRGVNIPLGEVHPVVHCQSAPSQMPTKCLILLALPGGIEPPFQP